MTRGWLSAALYILIAGVALAQENPVDALQEEDEDLVQKTEYAFNPIQARKEFKVGEFYWKKGSFRAAAGRYEEAVKWDPGYAEAYWKLALARERMVEQESLETEKKSALAAACEALEKFIDLESDGKKAKEAKEKLVELGRLSAKLDSP